MAVGITDHKRATTTIMTAIGGSWLFTAPPKTISNPENVVNLHAFIALRGGVHLNYKKILLMGDSRSMEEDSKKIACGCMQQPISVCTCIVVSVVLVASTIIFSPFG